MLKQDRIGGHVYRKGAAGILALTLVTAPAAVRAEDEPEAPIAASMASPPPPGTAPSASPTSAGPAG